MCCWRLLPLSVLIYLCPCVVVVVVCQSFGLVTWPTRFTIHVQSSRVLSIKRDLGGKGSLLFVSLYTVLLFRRQSVAVDNSCVKKCGSDDIRGFGEIGGQSYFEIRSVASYHTYMHTYLCIWCMHGKKKKWVCAIIIVFNIIIIIIALHCIALVQTQSVCYHGWWQIVLLLLLLCSWYSSNTQATAEEEVEEEQQP